MTKQLRSVFLIGESPLVEEWGTLFHNHGWSVSCIIKEERRSTKVPKYLQQTKSIPRKAQLALELTNIDTTLKKKNLQALDKNLSSSIIILSSSVTITATEQSTWVKHPGRLLGISALSTLLNNSLVEIAPTIHTNRGIISSAQKILNQAGKEISTIQDRVGMVMPRILCMIINESMFGLMENIATPNDIDTAMKLGTNYPIGPIQWGNSIGFKHILAVLEALHSDLGEERYRPAPLLRQLAAGRQWWKS